MNRQNRIIGILAVVFVLILGLGYVLFHIPVPNHDKWIYMKTQVRRGTLSVITTRQGALEYETASVWFDLYAEDSDDEQEEHTDARYLQIEEICVAQGQRVEAGTELIRFDKNSVETVRQQLEKAVADAKAAYLEAERETKLAKLVAKAEYDADKITQKYADSVYENTSQAINDNITSINKEMILRQEMTQALQERVAQAKKEYDEENKQYQKAKKVVSAAGIQNVPNYLVLQKEYLDAQTKFYEAENKLQEAEDALEENTRQIEELTQQLEDAEARLIIDILDAQSKYNEQEATGDHAQLVYDAALTQLEDALAGEEQLLTDAQRCLDAFEELVGENGVICADKAGTILEILCSPGDYLKEKCILMTCVEDGNLSITVELLQEEVVSLQKGDTVGIRFEVYPEELYAGTIQAISTSDVTEDESVTYQVKVSVDGDTAALYSGMNAEVNIVVAEKEDVLYVPENAVWKENGRNYVSVPTVSGDYMLREVEIGIRSPGGIEILSGLNEGDIVYMVVRSGEETADGVSAGDLIPGDSSEEEVQNGFVPIMGVSENDMIPVMTVSDNEEARP